MMHQRSHACTPMTSFADGRRNIMAFEIHPPAFKCPFEHSSRVKCKSFVCTHAACETLPQREQRGEIPCFSLVTRLKEWPDSRNNGRNNYSRCPHYTRLDNAGGAERTAERIRKKRRWMRRRALLFYELDCDKLRGTYTHVQTKKFPTSGLIHFLFAQTIVGWIYISAVRASHAFNKPFEVDMWTQARACYKKSHNRGIKLFSTRGNVTPKSTHLIKLMPS